MTRISQLMTALLTLALPLPAEAQDTNPGLSILPESTLIVRPQAELIVRPEILRDLRLSATQIEQFLRAHPELDKEAKPLPDGRIVLPPELTEGARYGFEKRMAIAGHGQAFDIEGRPVEISRGEAAKLLSEIQEVALLERRAGKPRELPDMDRLLRMTKMLDELRGIRDLDDTNRLYAQYLTIRAEAQMLEDERRSALIWRAEFLSRLLFPEQQIEAVLRPEILEVKFQLAEWVIASLSQTDYMRSCGADDVPVPPDFSTNSSKWTFQGNLASTLIVQGQTAAVYTYASPSVRGSCIALPRGSGGPSNVAGVICQSAETGKACFWDNLEKGTGDIIPFGNNAVIKIREMQDATELSQNCTSCHRGNNVFNISPDDPTWCRLLRGGKPGAKCSTLSGPNAANFTTEVDPGVLPLSVPGTNPPVLHSRYTPLSGAPARPGWVNNTGPGCGSACHLGPNAPFAPPLMPPACGANCN
ncbi:hypothetical protein [Dinoroseobacter sp. S375]|uniref:hypothetical protein n=1 Tax=Dinoroseobacter sp. S375 TaxID=3415136 RepID=UPI003C7ABAC9